MKKFIDELKRRNVIKATVAYLVVAWVLMQVAIILLDTFQSPDWIKQAFTISLIIGLPIWIIVSWIYDITPEGIAKTAKDSESQVVSQITNKRLNVFIIVSLSIAVIVMGLKLSNAFSSGSDKQYAIAILPFNYMNPDKGYDWFGNGITTDIHTYLSGIESLTVISLKSSMKYKDTDKTISEIAKELQVDYLVDGNVRRHNNEVRISASLINVHDVIIWADDYNENIKNPLIIQQAVAEKIVQQLKIKLSPEEEKSLKKYPTENMEAYQLYSKGRLINDSRVKEDLELNIKLNTQAVALDSTFAEAWAEIGQSKYLLEQYYGKKENRTPKSMPYLEKALQIDPNNATANAVKGMSLINDGGTVKWPEAKAYFEKAIEANPSNGTVRYQYAIQLFIYGLIKEQFIQIEKAHQLDPLSNLIAHQYFAALINNDKIEEAEAYHNKNSFLFKEKAGEKIEIESIIIAYKNKDWEAVIQFFKTEIEKDPTNAILYRKLGEAYDGILNNSINYIKYTEMAYELDDTNLDNAFEYFYALLRVNKFEDANTLLQSKNFKSIFSEADLLAMLFYYYYEQENYKKALEISDKIGSVNDYFIIYLIKASIGDRKFIDDEFKKYPDLAIIKSVLYAALKEKDSMYYYLSKAETERVYPERDPKRSKRYFLRRFNSWSVFDPYRKEERFKAILKKNYFPVNAAK